MGAAVRTVVGDRPIDQMGITYAHEHLIIDSSLVAEEMAHIHLHSVDEAVAEVETCVQRGVGTMVDAMPAASGRHPERLVRISERTSVNVVAATGLHTEKYYGLVDWAGSESPELLAGRFVADIEQGIDRHDYLGPTVERTPVRAGIVKAGSLNAVLSDRDRRLFEAAAITSQETGVPILTHTEGGVGGLAQIEFLVALGVPPSRIALSHTDKIDDTGYHRDMLAAGVYLCYDQALRDPATTLSLVASAEEGGFIGKVLMGTDGARRSLWSTLGGSPGLASLLGVVEDRLGPSVARQVFVDNPSVYFALTA